MSQCIYMNQVKFISLFHEGILQPFHLNNKFINIPSYLRPLTSLNSPLYGSGSDGECFYLY